MTRKRVPRRRFLAVALAMVVLLVLLAGTFRSFVIAGASDAPTLLVNDLVVVDTRDATLVASRAQAQQVKHVVEELIAEGRGEATEHREVFRPWGSYDCIDCGPRFKVKRLVVKPGARLSLQKHRHRAEHWVVVSGEAEVICEAREFRLAENESTYIPPGAIHRLANPGSVPLELIEVQSGDYLGEDDIERFEDAYGRHNDAWGR